MDVFGSLPHVFVCLVVPVEFSRPIGWVGRGDWVCGGAVGGARTDNEGEESLEVPRFYRWQGR